MRWWFTAAVMAACGTPVEPVSGPTPVAAIDAGPAPDAPAAIDGAMYQSILLTNKGVELFQQRSFVEAERWFLAAIVADPKNHSAWYSLGEVRAMRGRFDRAVEAFEEASALAPNDPMSAMRVGQVRIEAQLPPESARSHLERAVALEPRLYRAHYYLALVHERGGRSTEAARAFSAAIATNPGFGPAYVGLTTLYLRWQHLDLALQVARAGADRVVDPGYSGDLSYYIGVIHARRKHHGKAIEAFSRALDARSDNTDALLMRGLSHAALRNKAQARADLDAYLERGFGSSFDLAQAREAVRRLGSP